MYEVAATPEAEELAARLRKLKDRSGRSYGVLAGKLHVSTSTLHRYCNGEAVPTEFAPIERFARACGASSEELVAVHRKWILADEARRRGKGAPAAAGAGQEPNRVSEPEPEPAPEPEPEHTPAPGPEPESTPPTALVATATAAPSPRASGARRKRVVVAVAAAAVVALAVPAAVVASQGSGSGKADGDRKGAAGAVKPDGTASRSASPSASTSPSGSPSASAPRKSATPSATASGERAPQRPVTGVPVRAGVSSYNWDSPCGQYFLLDQAPGDVPPPPAPQDHRGWGRALGGVDAGGMRLQLTVTGKAQESVVLNAVHVRVVARKAPLAWQTYSMGEGCGSGITPQTFAVDLDKPRPIVRPVAGQQGDAVVPAKGFPYKVSSGDPQVLNLDLKTEAHDVSWYLEVDWSVGDRHGTVRVDDDGKPFRASAMKGRPRYDYWPEESEWKAR
ncbi:helix-turn-helix transcriptional regulator [Streptomyces sp. AM8-1-1]|uniref:helix-turn-helix domain-containing protein n=1 Tax=Streptomyces sp. AM8-1-1 TaxID=3075825 RepID=UPI0028C38EB0|nr:helix-turn-helix transcriptional regulator [Streptomyces sp. AM8-1-1]WNO73099.1 helix-turn-helix transcriptional regulator [Streptomyces sp. AM8-1-1]